MQYPFKPHPPFVVQGMKHKDLLGKLQYHKSTSQVHLFKYIKKKKKETLHTDLSIRKMWDS